MDLKKYKYINNNKQLPLFSDGDEGIRNNQVASKWNTNWKPALPDLINGATTAIGGALTTNSLRFPTTPPSGYFGSSGTTMNNIDDVSFLTYKPVDTSENRKKIEQLASAQRKQNFGTGSTIGSTAGSAIGAGLGAALGGATAASWAGPVGMAAGFLLGGLGGLLFGGDDEDEEKEALAIAQKLLDAVNESNRFGALTNSLQKKQLEQYGNTNSQSLFNVSKGYEGVNPITNETYKKFLVLGSHGYEKNNQNSWLDTGEWVDNELDGSFHLVRGNSKKIDNVRGTLKPGDRVAGSHVYLPGTKISMADLYPIAKQEGWTDELFSMLRNIRDMKNGMMSAKQGYESILPKFDIGWENLISTLPGFLTSWADYDNIRNQDIKETNIRPFNKYEGKAGNLMAGRRANMYPVYLKIGEDDFASRYNTNASAGLSAGQKAIVNLANAANTRRAIADATLRGQLMDNAYRGEEAQFLANLGNQIMESNFNADRFNTQMNHAAHNAKVLGMNMAKRNMLDYLTQFGKNAWEKKTFDKIYTLYQQDLAERRAEQKEKLYPSVSQVPSYSDFINGQNDKLNDYFSSDDNFNRLFSAKTPNYINNIYPLSTPGFMNIPKSAYRRIKRRK